MTHIVELPKESFVAQIGKDMELTVDVTKVPVNVLWHYIERELTDDLRDSHASVTRDSFSGDDAKWREAKMAVAEKKLAALYAGTIRTAKTAKTPTDPIAAEAMRLARVFVGLKSTGDGADDRLANVAAKLTLVMNKDESSADYAKRVKAAWIAAYAAKPETIAEATKNVEAVKARLADDIGL
jgi:hypothetical protein